MEKIESLIQSAFGGKLRIRVCGVLVENGKILLVRQKNNNGVSSFWLPPGGGLEYGESIESALKREFIEETNVEIELGSFITVTEFLKVPFHAIELFYKVNFKVGSIGLGQDPEFENNEQILEEVKWFSLEEIIALPAVEKHSFLNQIELLSQILNIEV
jgi:8-oxo-dGTP diphosphatase